MLPSPQILIDTIQSYGLSPRWTISLTLIFILLLLDLGVFNRGASTISTAKAVRGYLVWLMIALIFNLSLYIFLDQARALEFLTGYLVEQSLSVDNLFVFLLIFKHFSVPAKYQRRVLFYGIVGALAMRATFIFVGSALLNYFHWMNYVLAAILALGAFKIMQDSEPQVDPQNNAILKLASRALPITQEYHEEKFFVRVAGKLYGTPLLLVLIALEVTDLMFAIDSVPAIFAVTKDSFIVFTSNVFAILGLRSLFFVVAGAVDKLVYLNYGLAAILFFVACKMALGSVFEISTLLSLLIIAIILTITFMLSFLRQIKG